MAEAIARALGGRAWEVASAGSRPAGGVHPLAIQLLQELELSVAGHRSKGVEELPYKRWDYVITMGCGDACPAVAGQIHRDWDLPDPASLSLEEARAVRDHLVERIRELLREAEQSGSRGT
jgi:protein-tyrosine-phosphatase